MFCVYIIFSKKLDRFYIGSTDDFELRLREHNSAIEKTAFTADGVPWEKVLVIDHLESKQAFAIEKHIKKMKSKIYIQNLSLYPEMVEKLKHRFR